MENSVLESEQSHGFASKAMSITAYLLEYAHDFVVLRFKKKIMRLLEFSLNSCFTAQEFMRYIVHFVVNSNGI